MILQSKSYIFPARLSATLRSMVSITVLALVFVSASSQSVWSQQRPSTQDRHERNMQRKERRDAKFRELYEGVLEMKKTTYKSRIGEFEVPVYVFQPFEKRGPKGHAALIWVHGGVHGDLDAEHYAPFIREAVEKGYVVIAPEYRGSTGYGKEHYDAIDYGGWEVDDVLTAVDFIKETLPHVDPDRLGMIGWSHGGFITLHSIFREPNTFKVAAAMVPVTNLTFRLSYKGPRYAANYVSQPRIGGLPHDRGGAREVYIERSPVYHVDKLEIPLIVHVAENDTDVNFVECEMLIHALEYEKPHLAETKIYEDPPGGHSFNRQVDQENGYVRKFSWEQRDSWNRIWTFLELHLKPYMDAEGILYN